MPGYEFKKTLAKINLPIIFILVATIFGLLFVFYTPLLWGQDETTHFGRAYQISQGHIIPIKINDSRGIDYGGLIPKSASQLIHYVDISVGKGSQYAAAHNGIGWITVPNMYKYLGNLPLNSSKLVHYTFPNTAPYSPIAYIPSALGLFVAHTFNFRLGQAIYTARLFDLAFYITAIYFVLKALGNLRLKWLIFSVALLPMAVYQSSIITADSMTITLAFVLAGLFIKTLAKEKLNKSQTVVLLICAALLPLVKPTYLFLSLLILLIPNQLLAFSKIMSYIKTVVLLIGFVLFIGWVYLTRGLVNAPRLLLPGTWWKQINAGKQEHYILKHPITTIKTYASTIITNDNFYLSGTVAGLGFNYVLAPGIAIVSSISAMIIGIVNSESIKTGKLKLLTMIGIFIASITALITTFYLTISVVGSNNVAGILGRYFVPFIPLFLIIMLILFKPRLKLDKKSINSAGLAICILTILSLTLTFIKYYYVTWG